MSLASGLRTLVMAAACCLVAGGAWATDYYKWVGTATTGNWNDYSNWSYSSDGESYEVTEGKHPSAAADIVSIPSDAGDETLTITGSSSHTGTLTISRDVTLTGTFTLDTIVGTSTLTLSDVTLGKGTGASISSPIVISGTVDNSSNGVLEFMGTVTGNSESKITNSATNGDAWNGIKFSGNASGFYGTYTGGQRRNSGYIRDSTKFSSGAGTSAYATYTVGNSNNNSVLGQSGTAEAYETYSFGKITTSNFSFKEISYANLTIGALNNDSTFTADSGNLGTNNKITKVGSGVLTLDAPIANLSIEEGTVEISADSGVPNKIAIANGSKLSFAVDYENWNSFISSSGAVAIEVAADKTVTLADNFAGATSFAKSGNGLLELTSIPYFEGEISVTGGAVVVPSGTALGYDEDTTGSLTMGDGRVLYYSLSTTKIWVGGETPTDGKYTWSNTANWKNGVAPSSQSDIVIIPSDNSSDDLIINIGNSSNAGYTGRLVILKDVTLTGYGYIERVEGTGVLTLDGFTESVAKNAAYSPSGLIYCDLCVKNSIALYKGDMTLSLSVYGSMSGDGSINCNGNGVGFKFYGDISAFTGHYYQHNGSNYNRDATTFGVGTSGSANASWCINRAGDYVGMNVSDNSTLNFGCFTNTQFNLSRSKYNNAPSAWRSGVTIIVGGKPGTASLIEGVYNSLKDASTDTGSNIIRKVGETSTLSVKLSETSGTIEAEEGTTYIVGEYLPKYLKLTGKDAVLYVISSLDASSRVTSSLAAYSVTKSEETETIGSVEYYKYTLTASATSVAQDDSGTVYATIADAIANAVSGATITITGEATDNAVIPNGKTLTFAFDGGSYSGTITADDGGTVLDGSESAVSSGTTTYSCKNLYTHVDDLVGVNTIDDGEAYYTVSTSNFNLPGKSAGAVGTLNISGVGTSLDIRRNIFIGPRANTTGRINLTDSGLLVHTDDVSDSNVALGNTTDANATLNIAGGVFTNQTGEIRIGGYNPSVGKLVVSSGEFYDAGGKISVGKAENSTGTLEFTGGTFTVADTGNSSNPYIYIAPGTSSHGEVLVGGSAALSIKNLPVGRGTTSKGYLTVSDSGSVSISTALNAGYSAGAYGKVLIEDNGSLTVTGNNGVTLGNANSATGVVEIAGGKLTIPDNSLASYDIGNYSGARGELIVSGGTASAKYYNVGNKAGAEAAMTVSSGKVTAESHIAVGGTYDGSGTLTGTTGTYTQTGGTVTTKDFVVGGNANVTGTATISGGTLTASSGDVVLARKSGATATLVIDGGTLSSTKSLLMGGAGTATIDVTIGGGENAAVADFATGVLFARNGSTANTKEAITLLPNGTLRVDTIKASNDTVSEDAYVLFNGGVLAPHSNKDISSASMLQQDASQKLSFVIGEGGMIVSNDYAAAIDMTGVVAADGVSTPRLVKKGSGVLTLTTAPTFSGTITVVEDGGSVIVPNTSTVTAGTDTVRNSGEGDTYVFTYSASSSALEPGETDGNEYDTLEAAQTAAAAITDIAIPSAVSSVVTTSEQIEAYKALFSAQAVASTTTEGKYVVVVDFKADKKTELATALTQEFADVNLTNIASTGGTVSIDSPIAGLYYGVLTGTGPTGLTLSGTPTLSDGSPLNLTLPSGDGVQFYKLQVSTTSN